MMKIKKTLGYIVSCKSDMAVVRLYARDQFASCREKGCHVCTAPSKEQELTVPLQPKVSYEQGTKVLVSVPVINDGLAALLAFGLPLLITFILIFLIHGVLKWDLESSKAMIIIVVGFFGAMSSPVFADKFLKHKHPIIIEKYHEESADEQ